MIFWLAPMDGITDCPYRLIVQDIFKQYNKNHQLRTRTEFMSADGYMINPSRLIKHLIITDDEPHCIAQIYGGNIETLRETVLDICEKYPKFAGIELNIGCPSPKVMSCGAWAGMMKDKSYTLEVIKTLSKVSTLPFSIKTRAWLNEDDKERQFQFLVDAIPYCQTITVHGRTFKQSHSGDVDRDYLARLKAIAGDRCHIIGNGGIQSYEDALCRGGTLPTGRQVLNSKLLTLNSLDGIMIGQAAIGNPWIFTDHRPDRDEIMATARKHLLLMAAYEIYMTQTREQFPEMSDQLMMNRQNLHLTKKYDPDSDERSDMPAIARHDYHFPMPTRALLDEYSSIIEQFLNNKSNIPWNLTFNTYSLELSHLRSPIEFRKYFYGYVSGIENNKELKKQLTSAKGMWEVWEVLR